jgi:hypothetical protein
MTAMDRLLISVKRGFAGQRPRRDACLDMLVRMQQAGIAAPTRFYPEEFTAEFLWDPPVQGTFFESPLAHMAVGPDDMVYLSTQIAPRQEETMAYVMGRVVDLDHARLAPFFDFLREHYPEAGEGRSAPE